MNPTDYIIIGIVIGIIIHVIVIHITVIRPLKELIKKYDN